MTTNRFELLPTLIAGVSACAGGLAAVICLLADAPPAAKRLQAPQRGVATLRWPLEEAAPVSFDAAAQLAAVQTQLTDRYTVQLSPPPALDWHDATPARTWLLSLQSAPPPIEGSEAGDDSQSSSPDDVAKRGSEMRILLPTTPRWRAGDAAPIVVTDAHRRDWSVAGIDTFAAIRRVGRSLTRDSWMETLELGSRSLRVVARSTVAAIQRLEEASGESDAAPVAVTSTDSSDQVGLRTLGRSLSDGSWKQSVLDGVVRLKEVADATKEAAEEADVDRDPPRPVVETAKPVANMLRHRPTPLAPRLPTMIETSLDPRSIADYLQRRPARGAFPIAESLGTQLDRVAEDPASAAWAWAVAYRLRTLSRSGVNDLEADRALAALERAIDEALVDADGFSSPLRATELRRAAWAIRRRVAAWRPEQTRVQVAIRDRTREELTDARWAMSRSRTGAGLTLRDPQVALNRSDSVGALHVARRLEAYESRPASPMAALLASDAVRLARSNAPEERELARAIEHNYRNANLRVAIASELIDRLLPSAQPIAEPIRGRVAGAPVRGQSTTTSDLTVRLTPDSQAWRIGLEASGVVDSRTYSHGGPAVMGSRGATSFVAKKLVVLTPEGIRSAPAVSDARVGRNRLVSISTDYDRVPIVSELVRSSARREYQRLQPRAKAETRQRVQRRVNQELDQRVDDALARFDKRYQEQLVDRVEQLNLRVDPIEMRTTEQRLIGRLRIANDSQLAAHTPRMRAPSDSVFSLQLHESMLNNALAGLDLAGDTLTPAELRDRLETRLGVPPRDAAPESGVVMRFANADPVRVRLQDGRAQLTFAVDTISVRGRRHRDFKVHAFFRPAVEGLTAELIQDGTPSIEGRLRTASRLHLHGVFGKVLGEGRRVPIIRMTDQTPEQLSAALVGMATNQLVIEDGWLGLAIGPERASRRFALQVGGYVR